MTLPLLSRGKVREVYDAGDDLLLMVASDRISAFDVVMAEPIPNKGRVLTALSAFWFEHLSGIAPNHMVSVDPAAFPAAAPEDSAGRAMLVRRADMVPLECIVRGYLSGSAWEEYRQHGTVHGQSVPAGLGESAKLPTPMFTPSTKETTGHDRNLSFEEAAELVGRKVALELSEICLAAYEAASAWAAERGIIIADTKFELGYIDGKIALCDEVCTPDSSRFWPAEHWREGAHPPSFDKQPLRDWLAASGWNRQPPPPSLPTEVIRQTSLRYREAYERLSGRNLADWPGITEEV